MNKSNVSHINYLILEIRFNHQNISAGSASANFFIAANADPMHIKRIKKNIIDALLKLISTGNLVEDLTKLYKTCRAI